MIGLAGLNLGVGLSVFLHDRFSIPAARLSNSFTALHQNFARGQAAMRSNLVALRNASLGVAVAGGLVIYGMSRAVKSVMEFDHAIISMGAIAGINSAKTLKELSDKALELSRIMPYAATEIAGSMLELSKAGVTAAQMERMTKFVGLLGTAAEIKLDGPMGASTMLVNIMTAFNRNISQTGETVDMLTAAANKSTVSVGSLYESLKYAGAQAFRMNISFRETLATLSMLGQIGLPGAIAGTAFANMIRYMNVAISGKGTKKQTWATQMLGLNNGIIKGLLDSNDPNKLFKIFSIIQEGFKKIQSYSDKQLVAEALFGVRGSKGETLIKLLQGTQMGTSFKSLSDAIANSQGTAQEIYAKKMKSMKSQVQLLKSAWFEFSKAISDALLPVMPYIVTIAKGFAKIFTWLASNQIGRWAVIAVAGFSALAVVLGTIVFLLAQVRLSMLTLGAGNGLATLAMTLRNVVGVGAATGGIGMFAGLTSLLAMRFRFLGGGGNTANMAYLTAGPIAQFITRIFAVGGYLHRFGMLLVRMVPIIGRLLGPWGMLVGVALSLCLGFNRLKYMVFTLVDMVLWVHDLVTTLSITTANNRFNARQHELQRVYLDPLEKGSGNSQQAGDQLSKNLGSNNENNYLKNQDIHIYLNGTKVAQHALKGDQDKKLHTDLPFGVH